MKKLDVAMEAWSERGSIGAVLRAVGVDPDEEHEEPVVARWWEVGETVPAGHFHDEESWMFCYRRATAAQLRLHGPHPTEQAAREHYEAGKVVQPTPEPQEEYDASWTWQYYSGQFPGAFARHDDPRHKVTYPKAVAAVAKEAARREREKCAEEIASLKRDVASGEETVEILQSQVCSLRSDRDRLAAELAQLQQPTPAPRGLVEEAEQIHAALDEQQWFLADELGDSHERQSNLILSLARAVEELQRKGGGE